MAWKILSGVQPHAPSQPTHAEFPGSGYRIRFTQGENAATLGTYWKSLVDDGRYVLPYIETEGTYPFHDENGVVDSLPRTSEASWITKMGLFATELAAAFVNAPATSLGPYIEFGNEPNRPTNVTNRQRLWDSYIRRLEVSAPIFRAAGVGVLLAGIGSSQYTEGWLDYMASKSAFRLCDAVAIHCYSGGTHALLPGQTVPDPADGTPDDSLRRANDARVALDNAGVGHPEVDMWITEHGWPTGPEPREATKTGDLNGTATITGLGSTADLLVGYLVTGAGIPSDTIIDTIPNSTTITISNPATATATNVALGFGGGATDPTHQTYSTPAQQATHLTNVYTRWNAPANTARLRLRMACWFHATDYRDGSLPLVGDTPGNWPHYHGLRYEAGTPKCISLGGACHKQSWNAFTSTAGGGLGLGLTGVKPACVRGTVSAITANTATVAGTVDPNALATSWRIEHGPDANFGKRTTIQTVGSSGSPQPVTSPLTGLPSAATVHWRITAWNEAGFAWSDKGTFNTTGTTQPVWVTPTRTTPAPPGTLPIAANEAISSAPNPALLPNTQYFYRLVAENSAGTDYGAQQSFTTTGASTTPTVTTGTVTAPTMTGAVLNGLINPNGSPISDFHFEYGLTSALGTSTTPGTLTTSTTDQSVVATLTDLLPGGTYYYKLVATNDFGTISGVTRSFLVTPPPTGTSPDLAHISTISTTLAVEVTTHDGRHYRWDTESANAHNITTQIACATQQGDGFAEASCQVPRPIDLDWPDLNLLDRVRFIAADGEIAYEGRVAGLPRRVDSDGEVIEVQLQGLMSTARDRPFMEVYADLSGANWQQAGLALRLAYANAGHPLDSDFVPQVDTGSFSFKGTTNKNIQVASQGVLIWRAPSGCKAAKIQYRGDDKGSFAVNNCFGPGLYAKDDDTTTLGDWDLKVLTFDNTRRLATLDTPRSYLGMRLMCSLSESPGDNAAAHRIIHRICVYGDHGVELQENEEGGPDGVSASDVMTDIIERFCPQLNADGVKRTTTVISHLTFDTPTTPFDAFLLLNGYHLWSLGAWENGTVEFRPADLGRADWQLRHDDPGVTFDLQGDTVDDAGIANGMPVSYTDINDRAQVLWPDDFEELRDENPNNPANKWGYDRWPVVLELSNPVLRKDALNLGGAALREFNRAKAPGTITTTLGYVEDSQGNLQPGHRVRANDTLAIPSLPNDSPRLITATSWTEDGSLQLTLEQPPTRIDAVLARLDLSQRSRGIG